MGFQISLRISSLIFSLMMGLCSFNVSAAVEDYIIDTKGAHASIQFRIQHLGYSWLTGRFDRFNGQFKLDRERPDQSSVRVEIDTASINSNHAERDKHLRAKDFLDVKKFPKASFVSKRIELTGKESGKNYR